MPTGKYPRPKETETVSRYPSLDLFELRGIENGTQGTLDWKNDKETVVSAEFTLEPNLLTLTYTANSKTLTLPVNIIRVRTGFGFKRQFQCPDCNNKCRKLYLIHNTFLCRPCAGLTYQSQRESKVLRLLHRADKLRATIGGDKIQRPKYMRWRTFERIISEIEKIEGQAIEEYRRQKKTKK